MANIKLLEEILDTKRKNIFSELKDFSKNPDFEFKMNLAFGYGFTKEEAESLIEEISSGDKKHLPKIQIVKSDKINGANGAFDSKKNTAYYSEQFLEANADNPVAVKNLLWEELGHYIDNQLNKGADSKGDEGQIFANLVQGETISMPEISALKEQDDQWVNKQGETIELSAQYGDVTVDGNIADWTASDRLDFAPGTGQAGYQIYGKYTGDAYVFGFQTDTNTIGANTTLWLNTDQNTSTGYQIFGFAGGAEYNVNFDINGIPSLYTGGAGETLVSVIDYSYDPNNQIVEFAVPITQLEGLPQTVETLIDINNTVFLPGDYTNQKYTVSAPEVLPPRTDFSQKVGIVYSETTAQQFFDEKAYTQLFLSTQYQAMQAGIPFDILSENDVTDINNLVNYDTLIFPSFRNVPSDKVAAIEDTLLDAVYRYDIGLITAGDFLTNDQNNNPLPGNSYSRMRQLIDLQRVGGDGPVNGTLQATDITHPVMEGYTANETIRTYNNIFFNSYGEYDDGLPDSNQPAILADIVANGVDNKAVIATQTGGRNVHFATEGFMGDNNLLWEALEWSVLDEQPTARLNLSRDEGIFVSRNDMDQSQETFDVIDTNPGIYDALLPILEQWKNDYNFVGSYYINVGNNPPDQQTDWSISSPYYQEMLAMGNEIGTHSYTHPEDTNPLTPTQLEFEFNQSQFVIEQNLGIDVVGAAIPGAPEGFQVSQELKKYLDYVSGGYSGVGAGYPGAFGLPFEGEDFVYLAPNMKFDFSLVQFEGKTATQAEAIWKQEYNDIANHAGMPIFHWPWHDYGPTNWQTNPPNAAPGYTEEMFTNLIAKAYSEGAEFVTAADLSERIKTFEKAKVFTESTGNTITAKVEEATNTSVGSFGLNVEKGQKIQSVNNWYAYDQDTVFLPKNGGEFTINLGNTPLDVTRIIDLPMRAELISVTGNGQNLNYTFTGAGTVKLDLKIPQGQEVVTTGADSTTLNGDILEMVFNNDSQHTASISFAEIPQDQPPTVANPIANITVDEDAANQTIDLTNVFDDIDNDNNLIVKTVKTNSNTGLVTTNISGNTLTLDYLENQFGTADITVEATSNGQKVTDTFTVNVNSVDDAPTVVNPISDVSVAENAANTTLDLGNVFDDIDNDNADITKTVFANSNNGLVQTSINGNILTLDYLDNQSGTAEITVRGVSNGKIVDETFTVTVDSVDAPPTVANPIANITVDEDAANQTIDLTNVFDDIDNDNNLIVKTVKTNSNTGLVTTNISGNTLTLDYLENQFGTADITVEATSNNQKVTDTFTVNVNSVDDAPTIVNPISDVSVAENAANTTLDLGNVFDDIDNDNAEITKTVFANSNNGLVQTSINGNILTLDYLDNQSGTAEITIRGTSNGQTVDETFSVTVNSVAPPDPVNKTFDFTGNSGSDGADGNIRSFNAGDISVKTSAFSRSEQGNWEQAFLGSFSGGLGVTDSSEGNGSNDLNLVDNVYQQNYVLFEFSEKVVVDRAFLDSVVNDSDITYWVGTKNNPFNNHNILNDNFLNSLDLKQDNDVDSSSSRWADINTGEVSGNVLVIAASTSDVTPEDRFNIKNLEVQQVATEPPNPGNVINGTGGNDDIKGTVNNDEINGLGGDDKIEGKEGNDILNGGEGKDELKGDDGNDTLNGDAGDDKLDGQDGNDTLNGGEGQDELKGGKQDDLLNGDAGDDKLDGQDGNDTLNGGEGQDELKGNKGDDLLNGDAGNDSLYGGEDNDILIGVDPNSTQAGLGEIDVLVGEKNKDRFVLGDSNQTYYNDDTYYWFSSRLNQGLNDYALIADFKRGDDIIQLHGKASDYRLETKYSLNRETGIAIFLNTPGKDELIAIVQGEKTLNLTDDQAFSFV
ncbi:polysaccharide deacetylase family protein [Lyngbya sp. PCC 8106]|uniref:polysaccharide deacetylase family protein n=1 Tax=Lyngbya sp. (strain PCC 8106) TaxID=313612 RepID=UPI0000EAD988|nr:polysaccharide deacetylase family protein [Lyngbya sp. PCC 8106]EAW34922.1 hypothetical protein L8106_04039 [Lyngbya sp. PCC 8106]